MVTLSLVLVSPVRFEYMVSVLGLEPADALARVAAGVAANMAARLASARLRRLLYPDPSRAAAVCPSRSDSDGKLKAA